VVIEHNLEVIKTADCIIDLDPEAWPGLDPGASDGGGEIVAAGPPEDIVREKRSKRSPDERSDIRDQLGGRRRLWWNKTKPYSLVSALQKLLMRMTYANRHLPRGRSIR
jgi:hypothetical protein